MVLDQGVLFGFQMGVTVTAFTRLLGSYKDELPCQRKRSGDSILNQAR